MFSWHGGVLSGSGDVTVLADATLTIDVNHHNLIGRRLVNEGEATWGHHSIQLRDGAELINAGTLSVATVGEHHLFSHAGGGTFTNTAAGTITKSAGSGVTSIFGGVVFNNDGTLSVDVGEWRSDAGGISGGSFAVGVGGEAGTCSTNTLIRGLGGDECRGGGVGQRGGRRRLRGHRLDHRPRWTDRLPRPARSPSVGSVLTIHGTADSTATPLSLTTLNLSGTLRSTAAVAVSGRSTGTAGCCRARGCDGAGGRDADDRCNHHDLIGRRLVNEGEATWVHHAIQLRDGAELINAGTLAVETVGDHRCSPMRGGERSPTRGRSPSRPGRG